MSSVSLLDIVSSFPTALPTCLLIAMCLYWLLALIGLADVDGLHGTDHAGSTIDSGHGPDMGLLAGALVSLGLSGVPLSIVISVFILQIWVITALAHSWLLAELPLLLRWGFGALTLLGSLLLSVPLAAVLLRPLRGAFVVHNAVHDAHLLGRTCRILTLEVSEKFGQAHVEDKGNGFTVKVWARQPNTLRKGSSAVLVGYQRESGRFEVAALSELDGPATGSASDGM